MSNRSIESLDPRFQSMVRDLLSQGQAAIQSTGYTFFITDGLRTMAEQTALYAQGRTTPGKIVTNAKAGESAHNFGLAVDCAFQKNGKLAYTASLYDVIYPIARKLGFALGVDWKSFPDTPHFEYQNWAAAANNPTQSNTLPEGDELDMATKLQLSAFLTKFKFLDLDDATKVILENLGTTRGAEDKDDSGFLGGARREVTRLKQAEEDQAKVIQIQSTLAEQRQADIVSIAQALDLTTGFDVPAIKAEITALLNKEDNEQELKDKLGEIQALHKKELDDLTASYEKKLQIAENGAKELTNQLTQLRTELTVLQAKDQTVSWITKIINSIFKK